MSFASQHRSKIHHLKSAFTLIELLVVISIIAILIAVATVSYTNAQEKGRDNKRKSDLKAIQTTLEIYFQQNGKYPESRLDSAGHGGRPACSAITDGFKWGDIFTCNSNTYMSPLPKDPAIKDSNTPAKDYYYARPSTGTYILSASLENINDKDNKNNIQTTTTCTPDGFASNPQGRNYCVINP